MKQVVLATKNKGKIREFNAALATVGMVGVAVSELLAIEEPEETGTTFMENAILKANYYSNACGLPSLADDSGLAVDVLNGEPGVYSARYAGVHGDDTANNEKLIHNLERYPIEQCTGHYICALALVFPEGKRITAEGSCDGLITQTPKGDGGFGYDPYFYLPEYKKTMAELPLEEKNKISHRGKALQALLEALKKEEL